MAGFGSFLKGAADYQLEQNKRRQDEESYAKKLKIATEASMQLEERKRALAQQYPTYSKFVTTSGGDVIGLTNAGDQKQVYTADPETKQTLLDYKKAMSARANAQADRVPAQIAADEADALLKTRKANSPQEFMQKPRQSQPMNLLNARQSDTSYTEWLKINGTVEDDGTGKMVRRPLQDSPENRQRWQDSVRARGLMTPGMGAAPASTAEPDFDPDALMEAMSGSNFFMQE